MKKFLILLALILFGAVLLSAVAEMPPFGNPKNPPNIHIVPRYLQEGPEETGSENIVSAVILVYRGYDTMGEVTVIFTALMAILAVLGRENLKTSVTKVDLSPIKPSIIVSTVVRFLVPFIILFAVYITLHGEISPGGGFQGGAVIAGSMIVFTVTFGLLTAITKFSLKFRVFLESAAVLTFGLVGLIGVLAGQNFLTFKLSGLAMPYQGWLMSGMGLLLEISIGIAVATVFSSMFYSMEKVERS